MAKDTDCKYPPPPAGEVSTTASNTPPRRSELEGAGAEERETFYCEVGRKPEKIVKGGVQLRGAKATTLRRVLLARSCAMRGEDVVREVKCVDEVGVRGACH